MEVHFQARKGWINDPNGLCYFNGKYHMFFQHNPYDVVWDKMHWGHAVSTDLLHWEELPIALTPDREYEAGWGCFSGSAICMPEEDRVELFYTAVDREDHQAQCRAFMDRSGRIIKAEDNPFLTEGPGIDPKEFRDPKVTKVGEEYYLVCGTGTQGVGRVVLFVSKDLEHWQYRCVLVEGAQYGPVIECPDFFPLGDHFVLVFSVMNDRECGTRYLCGDFDGKKFLILTEQKIEQSPHFYAPQSFEWEGRRIQIGWLRDIYEPGSPRAGAMSIPREITFRDGLLHNYPVKEAEGFLKTEDPEFEVTDQGILRKKDGKVILEGRPGEVRFLRDGDLVEIFTGHGKRNFCFYRDI